MIPLRSIAFVAVALLVGSGSAQTVLLRYRPPVGKTVSYTMRMAMSMATPQRTGAPMSFSQTSPVSIRVVSRTGNTTTIETRTGPAKYGAGSPLANVPNAGKPVVMRMTLDQFGTPKGATGGGVLAGVIGAMGQGGQSVAFPARAVKVGDTWTTALDMGRMAGAATGMRMAGKIPIVYRLAALRGGVATIAMTAKGTMSMAMGAKPFRVSMDIRNTSLVDTATGLAKSSTTTTDSTTVMPGMGAMRQHMTMTVR